MLFSEKEECDAFVYAIAAAMPPNARRLMLSRTLFEEIHRNTWHDPLDGPKPHTLYMCNRPVEILETPAKLEWRWECAAHEPFELVSEGATT